MTKPTPKPKPTTPTATDDDVMKIGGLKVETVEEATEWIKGIIFGPPFAGKTHLAGSSSLVEEMSPVLVIDVESGKKTLREAGFDCKVIVVKDKKNRQGQVIKLAWDVLFDVYTDLAKLPVRGFPFKTIVFDNMSEGYMLAMNHTIDAAVVKAAERGRDRDEDLAEPKDYAVTESKYRKMIRAFRDLPCHVLFTAWDREKVDSEGEREAVVPSLAGKLEKQVTGYFDEAWYLYVTAEGKRKMLVREKKKIKAKTRTRAMPNAMDEPDMQSIYNIIVGKAEPTNTDEKETDDTDEPKKAEVKKSA